jgi:hypothetical protein
MKHTLKGRELLKLYRARRKCEVKTLSGYVVAPYHKNLHNVITNEIDIFISMNFRKYRRIESKL